MARPGLRSHPKFKRLMALLRMPEAHVLGHLQMLWDTSYEHGEDIGDALDVELAAGWVGDHGLLCKCLATCSQEGHAGFIEEIPDQPGRWRVHDLYDHAPQFVQRRMEREASRLSRGQTISDLRRAAAFQMHEKKKQMAANDYQVHADGLQKSQMDATPSPSPSPITTTTPSSMPAAPAMLPLEQEKPKKSVKPRGRDYGIGSLDLPEDVVASFDKTWKAWPAKGWNFSTKSAAPRRINRELALARFAEIVQFNQVRKEDGTKLTAEELADAALAWVGKKVREAQGGIPCVPCIGNFFSSVAGEKHPWKDAVLEFFAFAEVG